MGFCPVILKCLAENTFYWRLTRTTYHLSVSFSDIDFDLKKGQVEICQLIYTTCGWTGTDVFIL